MVRDLLIRRSALCGQVTPRSASVMVSTDLAGFLGNCVLYGVFINQLCNFYSSICRLVLYVPKQGLVAVIGVLQSAQSSMVCYDALEGFAVNFGSFDALDNVHMAWFDIPFLTSIIALIVQSFFAWRIYKLSENWILVSVVETVALLQCGAGVAGGLIIQTFRVYSRIPLSKGASNSIQVWLAASAACDIFIAVVMVCLLIRTPIRFRRTKVLVSKLVRLTIETGTITAICAVVVLILFSTVGGSYYACFGALVAVLYSNVALAVLNSRIRIIGGRDETDQIISTTHLFADRVQEQNTSPPVFEVNVSRTVETRLDGGGKNADEWDENAIPLHSMAASDIDREQSYSMPQQKGEM
ncbi:hypothetical protein CPB85DRAFT_1309252 [Mucidula mucida]|nr:hypothetical protein CPB85DRAFT_1309252 [Mucidula mucida]